MQTRKKQIDTFLGLTSILFLLLSSLSNPYRGNSWGKIFFVRDGIRGSFYIDAFSNESVYSLPKWATLYCSEQGKNNRLFCWYDTLFLDEPIAGWVNVENLEKEN